MKTRRRELLPVALVALAIVLNLIALSAQKLSVQNLNDSDVHLQMIRWAEFRIGSGNTPFDGWFPFLQLGSPFFHHYQSLPHIIAGFFAVPFNAQDVFGWSLYLLLSFWPLCIYISARLMGLNQWTAALAGFISPVIASVTGLGFEHASYSWQGYGVWSQLWGMWLLPLSWGFAWKCVREGKSYVPAALTLALTFSMHLITSLFGLMWIVVLLLAKPSELRERGKRAAILATSGVLIGSWLLVPFILDNKWTGATEYGPGTPIFDSYGAGRVLSWLFTGELFDVGRLPIVTVLLGIGFVVGLLRFRREELSRALVIAFTVSLLLYFGMPTFGWILRFLPLIDNIPLERFVLAVHMSGILLAAMGLRYVVNAARGIPRAMSRLSGVRWAPAGAVILVCLLLLLPVWINRISGDRQGGSWVKSQIAADRLDGANVKTLIDRIRSMGGGRTYAGLRANWGGQYKVGSATVYSILANNDIDAIGFTLRTPSLSSNIEVRFDEGNPAHYEMLNVRYLMIPADRRPPVKAELLGRAGNHTLWQRDTTGYFDVIDTSGTVTADRATLGPAMTEFLRSTNPSRHVYPTVAFNGRPAAKPTVQGRAPDSRAGTVVESSEDPRNGVYSATIEAERKAVVLLKSSFDPGWSVEVDGKSATPQMIGPSFVGVEVPSGRHDVRFVYRVISYHWILFLLAALTLMALVFRDRIAARFAVRRGMGQRSSVAEVEEPSLT